jgi:hypothetical protein
VLEEFAAHPNVGAVLLIGLGCETLPTVEMSDQLAARGVTVRRLVIQDEGGSRATAARGIGMARELIQHVSNAAREPISLSELIVAVECGGSDAWSGVTANPAVGVASDRLVASGGTVILSEVPEFIGAEHLLAARAADESIARQIVEQRFARAEANRGRGYARRSAHAGNMAAADHHRGKIAGDDFRAAAHCARGFALRLPAYATWAGHHGHARQRPRIGDGHGGRGRADRRVHHGARLADRLPYRARPQGGVEQRDV